MTAPALKWAYSSTEGLIRYIGDVPTGFRAVPDAPDGDGLGYRFEAPTSTKPDRWVAVTPATPEPPSLKPPQWSFLRRREGGRLGAVIDAAKAAMPPGDLADMFASIVDDSDTISLKTVLDLTAKVRAMAPALDVPTDDEIRAAWDVALEATPEKLLAALGG